MAIVLLRIDDRLIHGQVTIGWGPHIRPEHVLLVDDSVAENPWELDLYRAAAPEGATVEAVHVADAGRSLSEWSVSDRRVLVLVRSPRGLAVLAGQGLRLPPVNVGGMHFSRGKRELLPYVFVDDADVAAFRSLLAAGVELEARDLPGSVGHDVAGLIGET
jgi:PTS system mannose-specific IIB component